MRLRLDEQVLYVAAAEAACVQARVMAQDSRTRAVKELRRVATPLRIVVSGLVVGAFTGLHVSRLSGKAVEARVGGTVTGPLFSLVMETVLPSLMAGLTAGQVAGEEVEAAAGDVAEEVADQVVAEVTDGNGDVRGPA
jgi:hypothetical protein